MNDFKNEPKGRAKGGIARKESLTQERRTEIARNAALTRHAANRPLEAIRKGSFKKDFGVDVECYVLNDANKTAVITQLGMGEALGLGAGGSRLPRFIFNKTMSDYVGPELREKLENPLIFQTLSLGPKMPPRATANGYDVTILIDICQAIIRAANDGRLKKDSKPVMQASILLAASAKSGIKGLVYALAGYKPEVEEVIQAFKAFVQAEAKKYESEFPIELYAEWARLYGHKPQRSWKDMHLTINHVYYPIAKSDGKLLTLLREARESSGDRNAKLFQFLSIVGARALRFQLGRVFDIAENAKDSASYESEIAKRFGSQQMFDFL
mgnify:CR=1 FL=1